VQAFARKIRHDLYTAFFAHGLAAEATLAVLNIFENRALLPVVPPYHIDKAGFITELAAGALRGVKFDLMLCVNQCQATFPEKSTIKKV
jgi:hypothetical protein